MKKKHKLTNEMHILNHMTDTLNLLKPRSAPVVYNRGRSADQNKHSYREHVSITYV